MVIYESEVIIYFNCRKSKKTDSKSGMYYLRKKLADIEEARVEEIRLLRHALERNNEIQEERNYILKELYDMQK